MALAWLNRIGTAVPPHDIHADFIEFARIGLQDRQQVSLFDRMVAMADIQHRYSGIKPGPDPHDAILDTSGFYRRGAFPSTAQRMQRFAPEARTLASQAIEALRLGDDRAAITHLIVASCTGFTAPGLDLQIVADQGLPATTERTMIGFMGCFAAVNALRTARHIVRSEPHAKVLVVNLELCSLHLQEDWRVENLLTFLLFGDGAAACLVSAEPGGLALDRFLSVTIPHTEPLITWDVGDTGFIMHLSGQVPGHIRRWLQGSGATLLGNRAVDDIAFWAVHAGGRSILDAVQSGLGLPASALQFSRDVLRNFGNMSSATLVFVLDRILRQPMTGDGLAMAFGPGLSVETFSFHRA